MRFFPLILALLLSGGSLLAQQQERTLEQRILKPDQNKSFDMNKTAGFGGRGFSTGNANANAKNFYIPQRFNSKGYEPKEFAGAKTSWLSKLGFATKTKDTAAFRGGGKVAAVKEMPTRSAFDSDKTAPNRELHDANRTYLGKERSKLNVMPDETSQRSFARSQLVELKSIDDIRELLNKSK